MARHIHLILLSVVCINSNAIVEHFYISFSYRSFVGYSRFMLDILADINESCNKYKPYLSMMIRPNVYKLIRRSKIKRNISKFMDSIYESNRQTE